MTHKVHDASLDGRVGGRGVDGVREALETVNDSDEDVFDV